jgi:hypothetical protein
MKIKLVFTKKLQYSKTVVNLIVKTEYCSAIIEDLSY